MKRLLPFALTLLLPLAAVAQELEEKAGHHGVPWAKLAFTIVNFGIFVYLVRRGVWPFARNYMAERRAAITQALAQAEQARRESEALRAEWQRRLEHLAAELEGMLQQARADIAVERDQILAAARRTAEAIHRDAQRTAENDIRAARDALRAEVARQALAVAERLAPQRITATDQQRFVREFVEQVER